MRPYATGAMIGAGLALLAIGQPASAASDPARTDDRLGAVISSAIRAGGPFFTPPEQALIIRKCGYAAGEWDPYSVNISNGVLHCSNGRTVDDAEMRAMLKVAQPRISARVSAAMARPDVQNAISEVARKAARAALANIAWQWRDK